MSAAVVHIAALLCIDVLDTSMQFAESHLVTYQMTPSQLSECEPGAVGSRADSLSAVGVLLRARVRRLPSFAALTFACAVALGSVLLAVAACWSCAPSNCASACAACSPSSCL